MLVNPEAPSYAAWAKAYGVLVAGGVRKAFVVNKSSPHDKIPGLTFVIW